MSRLAGKVALVTGAACGQGAATARRFVAEGAKVMIEGLAGTPFLVAYPASKFAIRGGATATHGLKI